jgi:hypothetical protein
MVVAVLITVPLGVYEDVLDFMETPFVAGNPVEGIVGMLKVRVAVEFVPLGVVV